MAHEPGSWQWARAEAFRLGAAVGARIGQSPDGASKTVAVGGRVHTCATWLAVYTVVAAIAADRKPPRSVAEHADVMQAVAPAAPAVPPRAVVPPPRVSQVAPTAVVPVAADFVGLMVCVRGGRLAGRMVHVLSVRPDGLLAVQCDDDGSAWALPLSRLTG